MSSPLRSKDNGLETRYQHRMASARNVVLLLAVVSLGCYSSDGTDETDSPRSLVAQLAQGYDRGLTHRCECLVAQELLYDSVESCLSKIGWDHSGDECLNAAFDEHGTDELLNALRCHVGHLADANACSDAVSCEELLIDGACDAKSAENPCGDAALDLSTFIFEHCPQLDLHSRS